MDTAAAEIGEELESLPLLERLLRSQSTDAHSEIAAVLWDSESDGQAKAELERLGEHKLAEWEDGSSDREEQAAEG